MHITEGGVTGWKEHMIFEQKVAFLDYLMFSRHNVETYNLVYSYRCLGENFLL
jgi:hypothetical protein